MRQARVAIKTRIGRVQRELKYLSNKPRRVLFDHLPKCAGSALNAYLAPQYPERFIFETLGRRREQMVKEFQALPEDERFAYRLVLGHFTHGLLDYVHPETVTVTVLREPIDRIVSHYYYVKRHTGHYLHEKVMQEKLSLEEYIGQRLSVELQNWYTTHFSGLTVAEVEEDPDKALDHAVEVLLDRYDVVGFQEEFPAAVEKLRIAANLKIPYENVKKNDTRGRPGVDQISDTALDLIRETNSVDMKLYDLVRQKLQQ